MTFSLSHHRLMISVSTSRCQICSAVCEHTGDCDVDRSNIRLFWMHFGANPFILQWNLPYIRPVCIFMTCRFTSWSEMQCIQWTCWPKSVRWHIATTTHHSIQNTCCTLRLQIWYQHAFGWSHLFIWTTADEHVVLHGRQVTVIANKCICEQILIHAWSLGCLRTYTYCTYLIKLRFVAHV